MSKQTTLIGPEQVEILPALALGRDMTIHMAQVLVRFQFPKFDFRSALSEVSDLFIAILVHCRIC